jgi:hypothetical protein
VFIGLHLLKTLRSQADLSDPFNSLNFLQEYIVAGSAAARSVRKLAIARVTAAK